MFWSSPWLPSATHRVQKKIRTSGEGRGKAAKLTRGQGTSHEDRLKIQKPISVK